MTRPTLTQATGAAHSRILGIGAARGENVVTNDDIAGPINSSDEWIQQRTGIVTRRRAGAETDVLDLSEAALAQSKARLGERAAKVAWIVADVTQWRPARTWAIWHDRAVFHFLTEPASQDAYVAALKAATTPGATVVLATFALDGPEKCSGLPVQRYSPVGLAARLGPGFALTAEAAETHLTPWGAQQKFSHAVLKRLG